MLWAGTKWETALRLCNAFAIVAWLEGPATATFYVSAWSGLPRHKYTGGFFRDGSGEGRAIATIHFYFQQADPVLRRIITLASGSSTVAEFPLDKSH